MSGSTEFEVPETGAVEETPELNPRNEIMARIAERRAEQIIKDNEQAAIYSREATEAGLNFPADDPEPEPEPAPQAVSPQPVQPEQAAPSVPSPVAAPAPQVRFVEVDGQQYAVTPEQESALLRMGMMANTALHQYQAQPQAAPAPEPSRPIVDPDMVRATVDKLQYSSPDEAAAALTELISGVISRVPQAPRIDQDALITRAVAESRAQAQLVHDQEIIRQEYADLFEHPQRTFLAKVNVDAIMSRNVATGRQQNLIDVYREAGDMVREAMALPRPGTDANQSSALQSASGNIVPLRHEVLERKRSAPRATQAIDLRSPAPAAPRPPTGSELVDQMRKQRGQASMR